MTDPIQDLGLFVAAIGGSGLIGFIAGYALKKTLKIVTVIAGLFFVAIMYIQYQKMITVHWDVVSDKVQSTAVFALNKTNEIVSSVQADNGMNITVAGSVFTFSAGFFWGFSKG